MKEKDPVFPEPLNRALQGPAWDRFIRQMLSQRGGQGHTPTSGVGGTVGVVGGGMQLKVKKGTIPQIPKILGRQEGQEEGRSPDTRQLG